MDKSESKHRRGCNPIVPECGRTQTARPDRVHAILLTTSCQLTKKRDQKARVWVCKLRRLCRELWKPIGMCDPDSSTKRHEFNQVKYIKRDSLIRAGPRWSERKITQAQIYNKISYKCAKSSFNNTRFYVNSAWLLSLKLVGTDDSDL